MRQILLYIIFALFSTSCSVPSGMSGAISNAEELLLQNPDSTLKILESLRIDNNSSKKIQAKFALLYSQALDKNYIDVTNDSLINVAVTYYKKHGNVRDRFLSLYYLGRVQCNSGQYIKAMLSYMEALPLIEDLNDDYLAGLIYSQMSEIYVNNFDYTNSLKAAQDAYKHFQRTDYSPHQHYTLLDIGLAYANKGLQNKSMEILNQVIKLARDSGDTILQASCLSNLALQKAESNDLETAKKLYFEKSIILHEPLDMRDNACLAYVYAKHGKRDSAQYFIDKAWRMAENHLDSASLFFRSFQIDKSEGNYSSALENLEKSVQIQDSVVRETLQQSVVSAQKDYFRDLSEFSVYKLRAEKRFVFLVFTFIVFIVGAIVMYLHRRIQLKNLEISKYINLTGEIQNTLKCHDTEMSQLVQRLFKDKFELIDKLGCTYYERQNTSAEKEAIYNEVKSTIHELGSNKKTKKDLEGIVNACNNNVMLRIREQIPNLKETDYELLCYIFAGFSYRAISIFTQDKIDNIYNKKSRIKARIISSGPQDAQFFLEMIG